MKIWVVGAGGGGAGSIASDGTAGGAGGAGGVAYKTWTIDPNIIPVQFPNSIPVIRSSTY